MNDAKQRIMDEIEKNVDVFKRVSSVQYKIRCPICGDSQKNLRDAHCYIKCSMDPTEPLLYKCFKCNSQGKITSWFLEKLNIPSNVVDSLIGNIDNNHYNKILSIKKTNVELVTGSPNLDSSQVRYIEKRLGPGLSAQDYDKFKVIWDMDLIYPYITDVRTRNTMPSNRDSISVISDDKSVMLTRAFTDSNELVPGLERWKKRKLFPSNNKAFYTIKTTFDLFTSDGIIVNIAEGVFDVMSIYKNFNDSENSAYIAVLGSDYISGVEYAIAKGIVGSNVEIRVYIDSDIDIKDLKSKLKRYKWIFNKISIYQNIASHDVGTTVDRIKLVRTTV